MCLDVVTWTGSNYEHVRDAWKVMVPQKEGHRAVYMSQDVLLKDKWYLAKDCVVSPSYAPYRAGFHVFPSREHAETYLRWLYPTASIIVPVKMLGIKAVGTETLPRGWGTQDDVVDVIVADWMMVCEEEAVK